MKNPWVIIGLITVVLFGGAFWYASVSAEKNNEGIVLQSYTKGADNGPVTLVKYSDFSCPACAAFLPAIDEVLGVFGDDVTFEYRHFPFLGTVSTQAAIATEAAGQQGKFYEFHDLLFANQAVWKSSPNPQALFIQYAEELGLDVPTFRRHSNASLLREHVQADFAEGRGRGITGTPTFFLNGERMQIETFEDFVIQIGTAVSGDTATATTSPTTETEEVRFGL
jgi:protein-disulfide isomerase